MKHLQRLQINPYIFPHPQYLYTHNKLVMKRVLEIYDIP